MRGNARYQLGRDKGRAAADKARVEAAQQYLDAA
jgi:hypothetical protein